MNLHLDYGGLEHLDGWSQFEALMVCLMVVGQTVFVIMWLFLPWWREWVGRALMIKSSTLGLLLILTIVNTMIMLRGLTYKWMDQVQASGYVLVTIGVWSQLIALGYEIRQGNVAEMLHARETKARAQVRKFKPLILLGGAMTILGVYWTLTTSWDVLSLILAGIGIVTVIFRFAVARPIKVCEETEMPDEHQPL